MIGSIPTQEELMLVLAGWDMGDFNYTQLDHVRAITPYDLAPAVQKILECEGASIAEYEEARKELLAACKERWLEI